MRRSRGEWPILWSEEGSTPIAGAPSSRPDVSPVPLVLSLVRGDRVEETSGAHRYVPEVSANGCAHLGLGGDDRRSARPDRLRLLRTHQDLSLIHISEPTRLGMISYAV